ncbi:ribosomal protection-like ABC-F family protein [Bacillus sp. UNCCL81]|uniref:ribosomal protection-like ABC-F family protein n=1 Tax=Bacillus sp. UNCCL81 TaxID=1502755 RepID=UPI0008ECE487|nr:ABC-F family ATP-binding cassette domain-containing protein [Bacillus sp. UNCCL81]SFC45744.1 ATPase components of ABC transporters with duplicated ATPase domains [Bacillus sp. UNCCL81]
MVFVKLTNLKIKLVEAYKGDKVGIIGINGSGKSTILKIIAGIVPMNYYPGYPQTSSYGYDEGLINFVPKGLTTAYLEQTPVYHKGLKVIDVLNMAFDEIVQIENQMRELEDQMKGLENNALERAMKRYSDLVQLFEVNGGYQREEKLGKVCTGLKFEESFLNRDFDLLSGGEKTTVLLGKLLINSPDILLLDEPTNHLDMDSVEWLEDFLKNYKGIVLIVSHDRYFLDNVVTKIVEVEDMEAITYKGNYSSFVEQKEKNIQIQFEHFKEQQKKIKAMENTVTNLRDWAMRADNNKFFKRAASIQKKLDKLNRIEKPVFEKENMKLDLKGSKRSGNDTIKAIGLSKSYEEKVLFKDTNLLINYGERVGLVGPNGSGKTTFLKMLLGEEKSDNGVVQLGANVLTAYLPQKISFNNEEMTVLECFREDISIPEGKAREYLSKFMFYKQSVFKKVKFLSGGERIRLKLGMLLFKDINLLILDEPTNHLDIDSIETLEEALDEFKGTIFFISHDRYFINKMSQRVIAIEEFELKSYLGNYDDYKRIKEKISFKVTKEPVEKKGIRKKVNNKEDHKQEKIKAEELVKIERFEKELSEIDLAMNSEQDYNKLNDLYCRKIELSKDLELAMEMWLTL